MVKPFRLQVQCHATLGALQLRTEWATDAAWTVLFGPSGVGKSTLLRVIAGLWSPPGAQVVLNDEDLSRVPTHRRCIGLVAQQAALFPHISVLENIRFGCVKRAQTATIDALVEMLSLEHLRNAAIPTLSGGEYQRVAIARALASKPRLLLLDEVFTGMHAQQRGLLLTRLRDHCASIHLPVLSVTHDVVEACAVGEWVVRLGEDGVIAQGMAVDVLAPERQALRQALQG